MNRGLQGAGECGLVQLADLVRQLVAGKGEDVVGEQPPAGAQREGAAHLLVGGGAIAAGEDALGEVEGAAGLAQLALGVGPEVALGSVGDGLAQRAGVEEDAAVANGPVGEVVAALELGEELSRIVAVEVDLGGQVVEPEGGRRSRGSRGR